MLSPNKQVYNNIQTSDDIICTLLLSLHNNSISIYCKISKNKTPHVSYSNAFSFDSLGKKNKHINKCESIQEIFELLEGVVNQNQADIIITNENEITIIFKFIFGVKKEELRLNLVRDTNDNETRIAFLEKDNIDLKKKVSELEDKITEITNDYDERIKNLEAFIGKLKIVKTNSSGQISTGLIGGLEYQSPLTQLSQSVKPKITSPSIVQSNSRILSQLVQPNKVLSPSIYSNVILYEEEQQNKKFIDFFQDSDIIDKSNDKEFLNKIKNNIFPDYSSIKNKVKINLIYKATIDGEGLFHEKCDNKGPTLIFIKTKDNRKLGGFTSKPWDCSKNAYGFDDKAFIFSMNDNSIYKSKNPNYSIFNCNKLACAFGPDCDFTVENKFFSSSTYNIISDGKSYINGEKFSGDDKFKVSEMEVYEITI